LPRSDLRRCGSTHVQARGVTRAQGRFGVVGVDSVVLLEQALTRAHRSVFRRSGLLVDARHGDVGAPRHISRFRRPRCVLSSGSLSRGERVQARVSARAVRNCAKRTDGTLVRTVGCLPGAIGVASRMGAVAGYFLVGLFSNRRIDRTATRWHQNLRARSPQPGTHRSLEPRNDAGFIAGQSSLCAVPLVRDPESRILAGANGTARFVAFWRPALAALASTSVTLCQHADDSRVQFPMARSGLWAFSRARIPLTHCDPKGVTTLNIRNGASLDARGAHRMGAGTSPVHRDVRNSLPRHRVAKEPRNRKPAASSGCLDVYSPR